VGPSIIPSAFIALSYAGRQTSGLVDPTAQRAPVLLASSYGVLDDAVSRPRSPLPVKPTGSRDLEGETTI